MGGSHHSAAAPMLLPASLYSALFAAAPLLCFCPCGPGTCMMRMTARVSVRMSMMDTMASSEFSQICLMRSHLRKVDSRSSSTGASVDSREGSGGASGSTDVAALVWEDREEGGVGGEAEPARGEVEDAVGEAVGEERDGGEVGGKGLGGEDDWMLAGVSF